MLAKGALCSMSLKGALGFENAPSKNAAHQRFEEHFLMAL